MEKKKIITISLAFLIIITVGVYFFFFKNVPNPSTVIENQNAETQINTIEDVKIVDNNNPFKIDITYPQISGQDEFNILVKNIIDKELSNFKTNSLENDQAVKETDPKTYASYPREYNLIISYDKGQIDNSTISIVINVYNFEGGAHGATYKISANYDIENKKEITLADFYSGQENYLQKISDYCIADLTKQIIEKMGDAEGTYIQEGAGPVAENFKIFLINKDNITFYFPQYQVAPYVLGEFQVIIPR